MIDPSNQLAALIRAQFAAQFKAQGKNRSPAGQDADSHQVRTAHAEDKGSTSTDDQPQVDAGNNEAQIRQLVALRVRALSPNDPQRQKKAFRLFLESVLMQELGRDRLDNKGFDHMVDAVLQRMESDAGLSAALHEAGELLLSEAAPPPTSAR